MLIESKGGSHLLSHSVIPVTHLLFAGAMRRSRLTVAILRFVCAAPQRLQLMRCTSTSAGWRDVAPGRPVLSERTLCVWFATRKASTTICNYWVNARLRLTGSLIDDSWALGAAHS